MSEASEGEIQGLLEEAGAIRRGHFVLSSGMHSDRYCQCAALFERPEMAERVAGAMAALLPADMMVDVTLAPALGGMLWGYELARAIGRRGGHGGRGVRGGNGGVRSLFAERDSEGRFSLRRGFSIALGERVLLAEDVVTTGGSVMELLPLVEEAGGVVVGVGVIADRSGGRFKPGVAVHALARLEFELFEPGRCPLCARGMSVEKPGSRGTRREK